MVGIRCLKKQKNQMKRFKSLVVVLVGMLLIVSCSSDRTKNVQIKKAAEIHLKAIAKHDSIMDILVRQKKQVENSLESETMSSNIQSYKAMLKSLEKSMALLNEWDNNLVGVPGLKDEHEHGHNHSHDHTHHHNEDILDDMSDREILELQKAYSEHLDKIEDKISEVITTIELYSQDAEETQKK